MTTTRKPKAADAPTKLAEEAEPRRPGSTPPVDPVTLASIAIGDLGLELSTGKASDDAQLIAQGLWTLSLSMLAFQAKTRHQKWAIYDGAMGADH